MTLGEKLAQAKSREREAMRYYQQRPCRQMEALVTSARKSVSWYERACGRWGAKEKA